MALPTTDITVTLVKTILSEITNNVTELCDSPNINQWSLYKPANYGIGYDTMSGVKPIGLASTGNGRRLGDFRGYNHTAKAPISLVKTSLAVSVYADIEGEGTGDTIISTQAGDMNPTSNHNGYNPTYVADPDTMRLTPVIYNGTTAVYTGTAKSYTHVRNNSTNFSLNQISVNSVNQGTYTFKVKQESHNGVGWVNEDFIDGGSVPIAITNISCYKVTIYSVTLTEDTSVTTSFKPEYNTAYEPGNVDLRITLTVISGDVTIYSGNPVFQTGAVPGTTYNKAWTIGGTGIVRVTVYNNDTDFEYSAYQNV